jgi:MSHA biogenesis protein MshM
MGAGMYQKHFGLNQSPFSITPNPAFFYSGNTRGEILKALLYAVIHGEGIIKVTGEVGSGKTMLCRMLESRLPRNIEVIYLVNPSLSPEEVVFAIAGELNLQTEGLRTDQVLRLLHTDLIDKHARDRQVVLLVEEAQAMPLDTLEQIRLLTNLETAHHKLLQIVLFGQPELDTNLAAPGMRQLKERITHSFHVPALERELIPEFLACRLAAAGYRGPALFSADAVRLLARASQGIVRRINILADKAMLAAYADDARLVGGKHVRLAIADSEFGEAAAPRTGRRERARYRSTRARVAAVLAAFLLLAGAWLLLRPEAETGTAVAPAKSQTLPGAPAGPAPDTTRRETAVAQANAQSVPHPLAGPAADTAKPSASPATAGPPAAPASTVPADLPANSLLRQSLAGANRWLASAPGGRLALQILVMQRARHAEIDEFLEGTRSTIGLDLVHAYPLRINGVPSIAVVYGNFSSRSDAETVRDRLASSGAFQPRLVDIATIRRQVRESGSAD